MSENTKMIPRDSEGRLVELGREYWWSTGLCNVLVVSEAFLPGWIVRCRMVNEDVEPVEIEANELCRADGPGGETMTRIERKDQ